MDRNWRDDVHSNEARRDGTKPGNSRSGGSWRNGSHSSEARRDGAKFEGTRSGRNWHDGSSFVETRHDGAKSGERKGAPRGAQVLSARDVALNALRFVARDGAYAAQALDRALQNVALSEADRRLAASIFYFALENRLRIETCLMAKMKERPMPEIMDILCLAAAQILFMDKIPDHAAVDEAVKQARRTRQESSTALVNAVLRALIRDRDVGALTLPDPETEPEAYLSQKYSLALPLARRLIAAYGFDEAGRIAAWSPERGTETVRPNRMRLTDAEFEAWLSEQGFEWSKGVVPGAYRIANAGRLAAHPGYRTGIFSIQGESSMLSALALEVKPGMHVLDACAAPGGKTCLLAETMRGAGRVHAWDVHDHRVELIKFAANRLNLENVRAQYRDASKHNANYDDMMDAVLVDAPCSGLGVIGDKPDIKYKTTDEGIAALVELQRGILDTCAHYVSPGGLLVYSTCTLLPEENAAQVDVFLKNHPEFEPDEGARWLPECLRGEYSNGRIQILPNRDGLDGFFIARLRRKRQFSPAGA